MSACGSSARSTRPGTSCSAATAWLPSARSMASSSPKILTAILARVPDSIWSMRWEIGCPMVILVPGTSDRRSRISSRTTARGRPPGSSRTSISADSTPWTCSSSSARPVRRAVAATSGTSSSNRSMALPSAFDSARLVPGSVTALMTSAPSLNGGRKALPIRGTLASAAASRRAAVPITSHGRWITPGSRRAYTRLSTAASVGSRPARIPRAPGSRYRQSAGVTVRATTSDANSAIR